MVFVKRFYYRFTWTLLDSGISRNSYFFGKTFSACLPNIHYEHFQRYVSPKRQVHTEGGQTF